MAIGSGWSETVVELAGAKAALGARRQRAARSGAAPRYRHPGSAAFYDALAGQFDVLVPHHPGYGKSERPEWLRSVRDVAVIYQWLLSDLGIERASLIGLGFGGWIAAEMATMAPRDFHRLVLVGAMG